jgi:hypothetical protein
LKINISRKALQSALNDDSEFRLQARYWDGTLQLDFGDDTHVLHLKGGEVTGIDSNPVPEASLGNVIINAPASDWAKLLQKVPVPFYQDFYPASMHHGFRLKGDHDYIWPYYYALRRAGEVLRTIASVEGK